jgi:hypothetical protein
LKPAWSAAVACGADDGKYRRIVVLIDAPETLDLWAGAAAPPDDTALADDRGVGGRR